MKKSTYFKNLDFLRFVLILIIVCLHFQHGVINVFMDKNAFYSGLQDALAFSWLPVEFFFICSIFLGKATFGIFLTHQFIIKAWNVVICQQHPNWVLSHPISNLAILLAIIIVFGFFAHYKVEVQTTKYLKKKFEIV